jgi:hypothetical protein
MVRFSEPVDTTLIPMSSMLGVQATDQELFPVQTGKQRPEDRRSAFRRMHRFRRRNGTALTHERDTVPRDPYFRTGLSGRPPFEEPRELSTDMSASF